MNTIKYLDAPATLFSHVRRHAYNTPNSVALRAANRTVSYAELEAEVRCVAAQLAARNIGRGDIVALQLPNSPEFVVAMLAINAVGATVQMIHMPYRQAELNFLLGHSRAKAYIGLSQFRTESPVRMALEAARTQTAGAGPARGAKASLKFVIAIGEPVAGAEDWRELSVPSKLADAWLAPLISPDDFFVLLYTSGTTASPKGVPIQHRRFLGNAIVSLEQLEISADDVLLSAAAFTHLYGLFVLQMGLIAGASLSLLPAFTPGDLVATVVRDQSTAIFAGPAHFKPLLDQGDMTTQDFAHVRFICLSGTAVPVALAKQVEAQLTDGVVIQLWGMSELQAGSYGRPKDPPHIRLATAGRASPGTALRIVDDAGQPLGFEQEGRLQVRGHSLFGGYLDNRQATDAAFTDVWFDTGDIGMLTPDSALVITGRVKELINRGGVKFNPTDVELILDRVAGVERCVLVPMPDPVLGERTCAFVKRNGQAEVTLAALTQMLELAGVAKFKWPERLEFIEEMPLTPTQKVMRSKLSDLLSKGEQVTMPSNNQPVVGQRSPEPST